MSRAVNALVSEPRWKRSLTATSFFLPRLRTPTTATVGLPFDETTTAPIAGSLYFSRTPSRLSRSYLVVGGLAAFSSARAAPAGHRARDRAKKADRSMWLSLGKVRCSSGSGTRAGGVFVVVPLPVPLPLPDRFGEGRGRQGKRT